MLCQGRSYYFLLFSSLLLLPSLRATPVSSPDIANKSNKSPNSVQGQQQQEHLLRANGNAQDAHLNSLNAFAINYENTGSAQVQVHPSSEMGFKPSYKLPEMETNFTPMQSGSLGESPSITSLPSTPMLMQYLPAQTLQDGSGNVQYLQLIPTRPIIVPISPYLTSAGTGALQASAHALAPNVAATPDIETRGIQLSVLPTNTAVRNLHFSTAGLHGYTNAISPVAGYRTSYRINREAKDKHFSPSFSLNLNEYLPASVSGHETSAAASASHPQPQLYIKPSS